MRLFNQILTEKIPPETMERARLFAEAVVNTVSYADSNQTDFQKIWNDHFVSKIGEEAVKSIFERLGCRVVGPDYTIYVGKKKSWREDLLVEQTPLAVKTQTHSSALRYGLSWTFQHSDVRTDPILQNPLAWVCFVECNDTTDDWSCRVFPPFLVQELEFKPPRLAHLLGKKWVVYAEDLKF